MDDQSLQKEIITKIKEFLKNLGAYNEFQKPTLIYKTRELIEHLEMYLARSNEFDFEYDTELLSLKILLKDLQKPGMKTESYSWYHKMIAGYNILFQEEKKLKPQADNFGATPLTATNDLDINSFHLYRINQRLSTVFLKIVLLDHLIIDRLMNHPLFKKLSKAKQEQYQCQREEFSQCLEKKVLSDDFRYQFDSVLRRCYMKYHSRDVSFDPSFRDLL